MITIEQFTELAHRNASRYSHRSEPARAFYTFSPEALADFHRQVCAAVSAAQAQRAPDWNAFEQAVQEYVEDYEMVGETEDGRDACYTPNENDKTLLLDAFMGFDFSPWLLASTPAQATAQQERTVIGYVPMSAVEEMPLDGYVPVYGPKE